MKKLIVTLTIIVSLCTANLSVGAERYVMLKVNATTTTQTLTLAANEVAEIITLWIAKQSSVGGPPNNYSLNWTVGSDVYSIPGTSSSAVPNVTPVLPSPHSQAYKPFFICGPSTITLKGFVEASTFRPNFCVIRILPTPNIGGVGQ